MKTKTELINIKIAIGRVLRTRELTDAQRETAQRRLDEVQSSLNEFYKKDLESLKDS